MARRTGGHASAAYEEATGAVPNASRLVVIVSCVAAVGAMLYGLSQPQQPIAAPLETAPPAMASPPPTDTSTTFVNPSPTPYVSPAPTVTPSPAAPRIGIVAGHWGHDSGAVCPDGLTEVGINLDVARRVLYMLEASGYRVDLLEEFDRRLNNYRADALVSIHADSCVDYPNATPPASGFKVASVADSQAPEAEEQLVECLVKRYGARTGMHFHENSITPDMSRYHTFYEVNGQTPCAIIETGFMLNDRYVLTQRTDLVAQGIVEGITCFIQGETP